MEYKFSQLFKWNSGKPITPTIGCIPVYGSNGIIGYTNKAKFENKIILGRVGAYCGSVEYCQNEFNATDNTLITTCDESKIIYLFAFHLGRRHECFVFIRYHYIMFVYFFFCPIADLFKRLFG